MKEPRLSDPAFLLDNDPMHDGDLPGGAAEAEGRHTGPDLDRLSKRDAVGRHVGWLRFAVAECFRIVHLLLSLLPARGAEILIEVVEDRPALRNPLVVLGIGGADSGDQAGDSGRLLAPELRILQVDVVHDLGDGLQGRFGEPALVRRTSKLQLSPSWVISPSNMSVRRRLKVKADRQITLIAALFSALR